MFWVMDPPPRPDNETQRCFFDPTKLRCALKGSIMSRWSFFILGWVGFCSLACTGMGDAFNESFCEQYRVSFLETCTTICGAADQEKQACEKECQQDLAEAPLYSSRCSTETASGPNVWPKATVKNFTRACVSEGAQEQICLCVVGHLQQEMTAKEMSVMEAGMTDGGELPPAVMEAVRTCNSSVGDPG